MKEANMSDLDRYIKKITSQLDSKSEKEFYATHIRELLGEEADKFSFDEITQRIGEPEIWAQSRIENADSTKSLCEITTLKKKARCFRIVAIAVIALILSGIIWFCIEAERGSGGYGYYSPPMDISYGSEEGAGK